MFSLVAAATCGIGKLAKETTFKIIKTLKHYLIWVTYWTINLLQTADYIQAEYISPPAPVNIIEHKHWKWRSGLQDSCSSQADKQEWR